MVKLSVHSLLVMFQMSSLQDYLCLHHIDPFFPLHLEEKEIYLWRKKEVQILCTFL